MPQPSYPGVYIEELPSAVRTITGVATSVTAFVGQARTGPLDQPTMLFSFADYQRQFGGLSSGSAMSYAVYHYYQNGGSQALVVRTEALIPGTSGSPTPGEAEEATETPRSRRGRKETESEERAAPGRLAPASATFATDWEFAAANPGSWGLNLRVSIKHTEGRKGEPLFDLTVVDSDKVFDDSEGRGGSGAREEFQNLSVDDTNPRFVTSVLDSQSRLLRVKSKPKRAIRPDEVTDAPLVGEDLDGGALPNAAARPDTSNRSGIYALDKAQHFNLLYLPGTAGDTNITKAAAAYCQKRRAFLIVDSPSTWTAASAPAAVVEYRDTAPDHAAIYFPYLQMPDPLMDNAVRAFPPGGAIAGILSRTDGTRGVWKAPAGIDATLQGAMGLSIGGASGTLIDEEIGQLNPQGINCLRSGPMGQVVWGARTLAGFDSSASQWKYIPVRRLALHIEESLFRGTEWVVFEPNDEPLWAQIRLNVNAFMHTLFRQGAFQGMTPRDAYFVKCSSETTTQDDVNRGVVNIIVGFAPLKPAEFVMIKLQQIAQSPI